MNKRLLKHLFRKRTFTYEAGNIKIKSKMELTTEQTSGIYKIIKETMKCGYYYGCFYQITRKIVKEMKVSYCKISFLTKRREYIVVITNSKSMKIKDVK